MFLESWRRHRRLIVLLLIAACVLVFRREIRGSALFRWVRGEHSIRSRLAQFGESVGNRLKPDFQRAGAAYPPSAVAFVGFKTERILEVYAAGEDRRFRYIRSYPIFGMSGGLGPKLREGDRQVPEGVYAVESLNPNSMFHVSLRVNYPNAFDRAKGDADGRTHLGSDIMIHGGSSSIGCLAMGDPAAEELFVLAASAGLENVRVVLSPFDFRRHPNPPVTENAPQWLPELYDQIRETVLAYPTSR